MKTVILTGINGQLGKAIKTKLINENYNVIGIDLKFVKNSKLNFNYISDITDEINVNKFFDDLKKNKIYPDILINNAGIGTYGNIKYRKTSEIKNVMEVNLLGTINMIKFFYIHSKKFKSLKKIINISSIYGVISPKFEIYEKNDSRYSSEIYCSTKAGIIQMTKYFATNFSRENITVNAVSPGGIINTKFQTKKFIKNYNKNVPLKRMADVKDIVGPIFFLCSNDSNYINGQNIIVDGGLSC